MKKIILFIIAVPFMLISCDRHPFADFTVSDTEIELGMSVFFSNYSYDADYFEWDFGDGYVSFDFSPSHTYDFPGTFTVSLTAYHDNREWDRAYKTIYVANPTGLEVQVLEYYDEYAVPDASVILYNYEEDWWDEYNPVVEGFTDEWGIVTFTGLYPQRYYVDVWEDFHNNWILAEEDFGFVETDVLVPHTMNYFIAWVDYVIPTKKSDGRPEKNMEILKLERVDKRIYKLKAESAREKLEELKNREKKTIE